MQSLIPLIPFLPLLGFALTRAWSTRRWSLRQRTQLIWLAGAGYLGAAVLVTWQALRGQPLVAPDAVTLGVMGLGFAAGVVLALAILWPGRSASSAEITTR